MSALRQGLLQTVESNGWHINNDFLDELLQDRPNLNSNDFIKLALNTDLKFSSKKSIPDGIMIGKCDNFDGPCVVQVVKIKNIAAPKDNENSNSAPPFYKVTLTDGFVNCNALVMEDISNFNLETAPGTKLLLKGSIKVKQSSLLLNNQVCQVMGGVVEQLYSKWKATKELANHVRTGGDSSSAAPPWVPFGTQQTNKVDTSKRTLKQTETTVEDETSEFSQQRQAALAEAMQEKLKINKTFIHQTVDKTIITPVAATTTTTTMVTATSTNETRQAPTKKSGRFRRNNDEDDEHDYKDSSLSSSKPTSTTLFDFISKNNKKLQIKEPTTTDSNTAMISETKSTKQSQMITSTSTTNDDKQQQSNNNNNNSRRNNRDYDYNNSTNNIKERKSNLPPRLQNKIQNEDLQRQQYQETTATTRRANDRIQNKNYNEESPRTQSPAATTTTTNNNRINDTDNKKSYNNSNSSNNNKNSSKYNNNNRDYSNNGNGNNYYYPTKTYHNSNYNNNNQQKQMPQYYIASSPAASVQQQPTTPPAPQPQTFVPANAVLYFDGHPQQFPAAAYYNTSMYPSYPPNPYEAAAHGYYCAPMPIQLPIAATLPQTQIIEQQANSSDNNTQNDNQTNKNNSQISWKKGDECLAIYYSDKKYYPAIIKSIKNNKAYVEYIGYDDSNEVYLNDLKSYDTSRPAAAAGQSDRKQQQTVEINNNTVNVTFKSRKSVFDDQQYKNSYGYERSYRNYNQEVVQQ